MFSSTDTNLAQVADLLYEAAEDDDEKLANLIHELPEDVAHALCTSNLINSAQAYIYAFNEIPDEDIYDLLLLKPSYLLLHGIKLESVELGDIIFGYDKSVKTFVIGVALDNKITITFSGNDALENARSWARENCAE
ncbi:MAG TPA: hypothetical protein O0X50_02025 [Methanocorpusculum sp.]|nr:hypothetical protein [Methanocorpusculum sp.]